MRRRTDIAALFAAAIAILICLFSHLGAIGLVGPDEPRYAWIARAMATTGDWITPRLYGQPWFEKPVLYYWAAAIGFRLHLPAEWAARLPSAFAALVTALAIAWLGQKHYGREPDLVRSPVYLAPLLFSTCVAAIGFARAATPDMLFSASLIMAMAGAASMLRRNGALRGATPPVCVPCRATRHLLAFGVFLGLAVLAKGPAAIILAGGAIGLWALATNQWRAAFRLAHPIAIVAFCVVTLPWYVLCEIRNPGFIRIFIVQHNFVRYLTPIFQHRQPFWFFGPIVLLALLPWTVILVPVMQEGLRLWREKSWERSPGFFFACWALLPVLFFSFSQSKLPGYVLPSIPPLALLVAVASSRLTSAQTVSKARILIAVGASWIAMGVGAAHWIARLPAAAQGYPGRAIFDCAVIAIVGGIAITALGFFSARAGALLSILMVILLVEIAGLRILPALDPYISARQHGESLRHDRRLDRAFTFHLQRSWSYGLAFYLDREVPEWSPSDPEPALVLTTREGFEEIKRLGRFRGALDEAEVGILYVPVEPVPH